MLKNIILILLLSVPLFYLGLGKSEVYVNAEQRCYEVMQGMYNTGNLMVPQINGHPHLTKPPLFHWLSYSVAKIRNNPDLLSVRLVAATGALVAVIFTLALANLWFSSSLALWAALILMTTIGFFHHAHRGTFDTLLTAWVTLAIWAYFWTMKNKKWWGWLVFVLALAAGFMTKGPVGWLFPAIPIIFDLVRSGFTKRKVGFTVIIIFFVLLLSLPWYLYLIIKVPEAGEVFFSQLKLPLGIHQGILKEYVTSDHDQPFYYYLWTFPLQTLPFALFLPLLIIDFWKKREALWKSPLANIMAWLVGGLLFLSSVSAKTERYIIPLFPAFSLLVAYWLIELELSKPKPEQKFTRKILFVFYGLISLAVVGLPLWLWVRIGENNLIIILSIILLLFLSIYGWLYLRQTCVLNAILLIIIGFSLFCPFFYGRWLPAHIYIHEHRDSPERQAYKLREKKLADFFEFN